MSAAGNVLKSIVGWAEWTLHNEDGSVAAQGEARNIFTRLGRRNVPGYLDLPQYVALLDDERPAGLREPGSTFKIDQTTPTPVTNFGYSVNGFVRTMTGSFGQPAATRTIRKIGLVGAGIGTGAALSSEGAMRHVTAYLEISPAITQLTSQTFEIVYRLAVVPATAKHLKRWQTWGPLEEQAFATDLINGPLINGNQHHAIQNVVGSHFFFDAGASYRGPPSQNGADNWRTGGPSTFSDGTVQRRGRDTTSLVIDANNSNKTGPVGMVTASRGSRNGDSGATLSNDDRTYGFFPLVAYEGTFTSVFKHPTGETYWWNVVGSVALSQGNVEVRGPFIPDEHKSPWHYLYAARILDAGDTDPGTEGTYTMWQVAWMGGYAYPSLYAKSDGTWANAIHLSDLYTDPLVDVGVFSRKNGVCFDGECYYFTPYLNGTSARVFRWRAGSNEQVFTDVTGDTTRFYGFDARTGTNNSYAVASDEAGKVFVAERNSVPASQKFYVLDNAKNGRQYQRPSGIVASGSPQTFTVDAADEIHAMFPFVVGDVGRKIRIVNTVSNGADTVRTITAYNGPNSVDVDGAAFVTEGGMTWHWVPVTKKSTAAWPVAVNAWLGYDKVNGRLWTFSASGLHYSTDDGATWSTIDELNGLTTALAKAFREPDGGDFANTACIGPGGKLYWIDTNNGINKYTPGPSIHSGTHERITMAAMPTPPSGYTKGTFTAIYMDAAAPDAGANTDGALWVGQDRVNFRGFFRVLCGPTFTAAGATAFSEISIGGSAGSYLDHSFQNAIVTPDGRAYLQNMTRPGNWKMAYFDETTGVLTFVNAGDIIGGTIGVLSPFHVRPNGNVFLPGNGDFAGSDKNHNGVFAGTYLALRYNDLLDTWVPWHGSAAQFNTRYGTTNGGARKCHASWQKVAKGQQSNNLELRFVQNGSVAPTDEYVAGEMFSWGAAWGACRTNTQDLTWRADFSMASVEPKVEAEAIKTVAGRGSLNVFYTRQASVAAPSPSTLGVGIPALDNAGINFGWSPSRTTWIQGGGDAPDTSTAFGPTSFSQHLIGIDLGAGAPAISKLHVMVQGNQLYYLLSRYLRTAVDRGRMRVYYSDDNSAWTEVPDVRFQLNGASQPDAGYRYVYVTQYVYGGDLTDNIAWQFVTFDLEAAGLSALARTHRYWQIHIGTSNGQNMGAPLFGGVFASDSSWNPIGLTVDHRTDEAHDVDHGASWLYNIDFVQTRTGLSGQGGVNTVDDGDADGRTNTITIASGSFNTGVISTVTDFLAWKEAPGYGNGFMRKPHGEAGRAMPWSNGSQARSKIVSATSTTIVVADDIVPDNLSAVDFEIRRPAAGTILTAGSMPRYCLQTGYMQFHDSDIGREYRITRKGIVRLP